MRDQRKYFPVNWIDGMKINKRHFIDQDNASADALHDQASLFLSTLRYGILPPSSGGEKTFAVSISADSMETLRVTIHACQAITPGGVRISLPDVSNGGNDKHKSLEGSFPFSSSRNESASLIFLFVHPFNKLPAGSMDMAENPPRYPYMLPTYSIELIPESESKQYISHPYALPVGRVYINGSGPREDREYIPPCFSVESHTELLLLHGKVSAFLVNMEKWCSRLAQSYYKKNSPTEVFQLTMFLVDRMMLCLAQSITAMNWHLKYEPPAMLFSTISTLARVMMNTINMRIGSDKEKLLLSFIKAEPQAVQLETVLKNMANDVFSNNDIHHSRQKLVSFMDIASALFETLSEKEFGEDTGRSGTFVQELKEEEEKEKKKEKDRDRPSVHVKDR